MSKDSGANVGKWLGQGAAANTLRAKAHRAIFRLIAGGIGLPYYEKIRENLDTIEGRSRINALVAEEIGRQAISDPEFMERAKARFLGDLSQKQANVEAVALIAHQSITSNRAADERHTNDELGPSDDWMNTFSRAAEDASSEVLRQRLARVLAGELRHPASFSRSTIRFIAEVDQDSLFAFQGALSFRFGDQILAEDSRGVRFAEACALEAAGLILGSAGFTNASLRANAAGNAFLLGTEYGLVVQSPSKSIRSLRILSLTKVGREVAELLDKSDEKKVLRFAAEALQKGKATKIFLGRIKHLDDNDALEVLEDECVWPIKGKAASRRKEKDLSPRPLPNRIYW